MKDKILLVVGANYVWRANIGFKPKEADKDKESFIIVYNFFRNLRATIEEFGPDKVFFCCEGANNFRYSLFSEYKANRIKTASKEKSIDDFNRQRDIIINLISNLPITVVKADGFECDDVIATLADNLKDENVIVISNDTDFIQLLQKGYKNLRIYNPFKKEYVSAPEFFYLVHKVLAGDKSDNIPGLVSKKVADALVSDPDKLKEFLSSEENRANFNLNKSLIELRIVDDDKLQFTDYNINLAFLKEEFERMEFNSMFAGEYWGRFCDTFNRLR